MAAPTNPEPELDWLFLDLNSYFASVEQEVRPELRNRPVAVVPMMADTTCCIAASYEAKAKKVKTGTLVREARELCPDIVFIEARHDLYVRYHDRILQAVDTCIPITRVCSIDEMACRLVGRERPLRAAMELGRRVKQAIRDQVGSTLRCSVGIATNSYLAKIASDMEKPDGLVALPLDILPSALRTLTLRDLPGVGARTERRLNAKGLHTMEELLSMTAEEARNAWGSVLGERIWRKLRGEDLGLDAEQAPKSLSHQHILGPELRNMESAWAVAHKLLHKAAMRMRKHNLWASRVGLSIGFMQPRESGGSSAGQATAFRPRAEYWSVETRVEECQDNATLIAALAQLWETRPRDKTHQKPYFLCVFLNQLVPDDLHMLSLFDSFDRTQERKRLLSTMDSINYKYGLGTLAPAAMLDANQSAPTRISFSRIPEKWELDS